MHTYVILHIMWILAFLFGSSVMSHYFRRDLTFCLLSGNFQQTLKDSNLYVIPSQDQVMHKLHYTLTQQSLDLAWKALRELKEYNGFVEVLQFTLAMGNYLNAGSRQGGAYGFKLSTLPKVCLLSVV